MAEATNTDQPPITIKKYANRRLYNTATSSYVTLDHLAEMVKEGTDFAVYDAKTGDDITRQVLTHIIVEEEGKGQNLLPISFLRHLISFYGDSLQTLVPGYLESSMQAFARNQEEMRDTMRDTLDGLIPFSQFEEMGKQNMAMFEKAMGVFSPMHADSQKSKGAKAGKASAGATAPAEANGSDEQIDAMRGQLEEMQRQLNSLSQPAGKSKK